MVIAAGSRLIHEISSIAVWQDRCTWTSSGSPYSSISDVSVTCSFRRRTESSRRSGKLASVSAHAHLRRHSLLRSLTECSRLVRTSCGKAVNWSKPHKIFNQIQIRNRAESGAPLDHCGGGILGKGVLRGGRNAALRILLPQALPHHLPDLQHSAHPGASADGYL